MSEPADRPEPARTSAVARGARVAAVLTALLVPAWLFFAYGRQHLNLADEGYLWYGVLRTLAGEWPLRDFQAYDPARYHWCALWSPLVGDGIVGVRAATNAFAALGLAAGLAVLARAGRGPAALALAGIVLGLWLFPRHKLYEPATALILLLGTARMLADPTPRRCFAAGLLVGLATCMGRNHAFYGALAGAAALALDRWKDPRPGAVRRVAAWAGGVVAGALPFAVMLSAVPGLAAGFAYSVRLNLVHGTNLPLPWPWPWRLAPEGPTGWETFRALVKAAAFLLPVLAVPALAWTVARTPRPRWRARAPLVASALLGTVYLHHAVVRADMAHLAQAVAPLLVAVLLLPGARRAWMACAWSALSILSLAVAVTWNPHITLSAPARELVGHVVAGERLELFPAQASYLAAIERTVAEHVDGGPLFIAPNRATLYCVLGKRAPTWWIYHFWKVPPAEQDATIARLAEQGFDWALIVDAPMDDRADLLFRSTNDRVWAHFEREWERVPTPGLPADHILLHRILPNHR